jgi:chromosome segregation ATPase
VEALRRAEAAERRLTQSAAELERIKAEWEKQAEEREGAEEEWREQLAASKALARKLETAWTGAVERSKRVEAELSNLRQEVEELSGKLTTEQSSTSEFRRRAEASERRARQYALELERTKTATEASDSEPGHMPSEYSSQRTSLKTPGKVAAAGTGTKPPERRNGVRGDSYTSPSPLYERYNLQP